MTLRELVRLHKLKVSCSFTGLWGQEVEFTNPDPNTLRSLGNVDDYEISMNIYTPPTEAKTTIRMRPKPNCKRLCVQCGASNCSSYCDGCLQKRLSQS